MKCFMITLMICCTGFSMLVAEEGFKPLFNGETLDGWVNVNCAPETWTVKDGKIVCTGIPTGIMRTDKQYENYILELEWKHLIPGGNAGLFVHSDAITAVGKPFSRSIECQIMDGNHGDMFAIHGATLAEDNPEPKGWMRSYPKEERVNPAGEWNHYRVESRDGTLTLAVNGTLVTRGYHLNPRKGYICLESEGSEIHFKNIRIKEMPGSLPPPELIAKKDEGFVSLYNGLDFRGWKDTPGNEGHWQADNWVIKYDGKSEAEGEDKHLWTKKACRNFILIVDWMFPKKRDVRPLPVILPNGSQATGSEGEDISIPVDYAGDSGIYLRGSPKSQINIWNWPVGSGEIYGYRTDKKLSPEIRQGVTPILKADKKIGEWNRFVITLVDETVSVMLNGKTVLKNARLPGIPETGPLALQHHGDPIQFANIYIKELD